MERDVDDLDAGSRKRKGFCNGGLHEPPGVGESPVAQAGNEAGARFARIPLRAVTEPGLTLTDLRVLIVIAWHANKERKPVLDETGQQKRDANGRPQYVAIGEWTTRTLSDRFSARVIELIEQQYPGALGRGRAMTAAAVPRSGVPAVTEIEAGDGASKAAAPAASPTGEGR